MISTTHSGSLVVGQDDLDVSGFIVWYAAPTISVVVPGKILYAYSSVEFVKSAKGSVQAVLPAVGSVEAVKYARGSL